MQVETISSCRICNSSNLEDFIYLGTQALSGHFPKPGEFVPSSRLKLVECKSCGLIQLTESVDKNILYGNNYGYHSSLNRSMVSHLKSIADMIKSRKMLNEDSVIVDIGANDGTFLKNFVGDRLAIDPTIKKFSKYYVDTGIKYIEDFFSSSYIVSSSCDVITSFAMFYDLDNPVEFASGIAHSLKSDGIWVLEVADFPRLASMGVYDVICHEHLQYYGFKQLDYIMKEVGLFINEAIRTECNGGSLLLFVSKKDTNFSGFQDYQFGGYEKKVKDHRVKLMEVLEEKNVAGFGASTKGNTIIQYCGITKQHLPFIIDINPEKFGCVTPGSNIPIVSEGEAEYYLVFPWHFKEGIIANNPNKKFIFPLPILEVIGA